MQTTKAKSTRATPASEPPTLKVVESRHDKFVRLANRRAKRAIYYLQAIARLGSSEYERRPEEVDKLGAVLKGELDKTMISLRRGFADKTDEDII